MPTGRYAVSSAGVPKAVVRALNDPRRVGGQRELVGAQLVGLAGKVQGEAEQEGGVGVELGGRAAGDPRTGTAPSDDERAGQPAAAADERLHCGHPGLVEGRRTSGDLAPGDEPRLLDEHDRPPRGRRGPRARRRGRARRALPRPRARARRCRTARAGRHTWARAGPWGVAISRTVSRGAAHAPITSPVIGSTTPSSSAAGAGSISPGPLLRVAPTARPTGCASNRPGSAKSRTPWT